MSEEFAVFAGGCLAVVFLSVWIAGAGIRSKRLARHDMRVTPVNNPLDYREDGSIRPGDPAYDMMMEAMNSGRATISNQREDGTWDVKQL